MVQNSFNEKHNKINRFDGSRFNCIKIDENIIKNKFNGSKFL